MSDDAKSPTEFTRAALATLRRRWRDKIGEGRMTDLERARWLLPDGTDEVEVAELAGVIAAARREGAETERAEWMSCARVDAMMEGPALKGWNRSALDRLWRRGLTPEEPTLGTSSEQP